MKKIVVIDCDRQSERLIKKLLDKEGFSSFSANSFSQGLSLISHHRPSVVIIDPLYPKKEGINLITSVKEWCDCQIIAVSSNGTELAAVELFNSGVDDFIRKPFFSKELIARINVCFKNLEIISAARGISTQGYYVNQNLKIDLDNNLVSLNEKHIHLTVNELKLISLLCRHAGKILTYDFILKSVWGQQSSKNTGILRVNVANLRKKLEKNPLEPEYIFTENGIGYRLAANQFSSQNML